MRIAMVGCGAIAQHGHVPAIRRSGDVVLTAVVDADREWAERVSRRTGAQFASADHRDLVGRVDAAIVATPNATHVEVASFLLQHGIHVLCEKPLARSAAEACQLYEVAERCGVRLMAGHSRRFTDGALALQRLMAIGALGSIGSMWGALGAPMAAWRARQDFRSDSTLAGGGCLIDSGTHLIDLALWLTGEQAGVERFEVSAQARPGLELDALVALRFERGATARLACSYSHELGSLLEVRGSEGWARLPINGSPGLEFSARSSVVGRSAGVQRVAVSGMPAYERQLQHFVAAIRGNEPFLVTPNEVVGGLRIVEECYARAA